MNSNICVFDLLRDAFPKVDVRIIRATALEHGDDVKSAFIFLHSLSDEEEEEEYVSPGKEGTESCGTPATQLDYNTSTELDTDSASLELSSSYSQISLASLQEIVEVAKCEKETVINLVKEVGDLRAKADQERAAALRAKTEAATIGEDLLRQADELRKKMAQRKQENLLRMGEVYGEKAVLATEARGLKLRLEQVKLQKERAVTTLHEIKASLQACFEEAVEERLTAEEDGRAKEKLAQDILAVEEAFMTTVEEESRKLEVEAEACAQLKNFLSHHGSIIDSLQGEMCVLCEDVESFKRQVDEGMWSSVSTASLPANVNPEGPYIFRKCQMSSTSSSQELGQSFEALCSSKQFDSRMSAPSTQGEMADCVLEPSNGSSQGYDRVLQHQSNGEDSVCDRTLSNSSASLSDNSIVMDCGSYQTIQNSGALLDKSRDYETSMTTDCDRRRNLISSTLPYGDSRESMGSNLTDAALRSDFQGVRSSVASNSTGTWACSNGTLELGYGYTDPSSNSYYPGEKLNFSSALCAGNDWLFRPEQMDESRSSTSSSSLVKIEADDCHSD